MKAEDLQTFTRFDSIKLPKVKMTKEGYLRGDAIITRAGVFDYRNADGSIVRELRHPDDVFKPESLETLKMLPITVDHPPEFVDAKNAHKYDRGSTGESYRIDGDYIISTLTVRHQDAINAIEDGNHEISMGYSVKLIPEKGIYEGKAYDFRQINHEYNHLALVEKGRAGSLVRLRYDSAAELIGESRVADIVVTNDFINLKQEEKPIMKEEVKNMDETIQLRVDSLNAELKQLKVANTLLQEKLDSAEIELKKEKQSKSEDIITKQVMDRADLLLRAAPYLGNINQYINSSDREVMVSVMNANRTDAEDYKDRSDDFIKGAFELFISANSRMDSNTGNIFNVIAKRQDSINPQSIHDQFVNLINK